MQVKSIPPPSRPVHTRRPFPPVYLREMRADDREPLLAILRATREFKASEVPVAEELLDAFLDQPLTSGYYVWVALEEEQSRRRGYVCFGPTPLTEGTWDIYWIVVDNAFRGTGHERLAAFIHDRLGRLPQPGDRLTYRNIEIEVRETAGNKLEKVLLRRQSRA